MKIDELMAKLDGPQRKEFDSALRRCVRNQIEGGHLFPDQLYDIAANIKLQEKIYLDVGFVFKFDENNKYNINITDVEWIGNLQDYLVSCRKNRNNGFGNTDVALGLTAMKAENVERLREFIRTQFMGELLSFRDGSSEKNDIYLEMRIPKGTFFQPGDIRFHTDYVDFENRTMGATVKKEHWIL
ncbi:MAG TPA: hypothetical protein VFD35_09570 [Pricia sp.]|nr:hypothetical protein [Pricia sp.]